MKNFRPLAAAASLFGIGAVVSAALTVPSRPLRADTPRPDATQVKTLYSDRCSACHNLPKPDEKGYSRAEWQRTVNTMLTKYHASDSITPSEAVQIVDYLATFAPKATTNNGGGRGDRWATDETDVWTDAPAATRVFNFESGAPLSGLAPLGAGTPGPAPAWSVGPSRPGVDGAVARVSAPGFRSDRFALLVDRTDTGRNLDVRVRFRIESGKASPAVGIAFGYTDPDHYIVLRGNQALGDVALIQISGPTHTTLQQTPFVLPPPTIAPTAATATPAVAPPPAVSAAAVPPAPLAPGWHTLRLLVRDGQVRGWLDLQKRISTILPAYSGGKVGLWTQGSTVASFDDWTVDIYDGAGAAPLS